MDIYQPGADCENGPRMCVDFGVAGIVYWVTGVDNGVSPLRPRSTSMSQYLLAVHYVEGQAPPSPTDMERMYRQVDEVNAEMKKAGVWVFAGGLKPPTTATVVRAQGGEVLMTDGPFPEAKEQLGGFWVIEVDDLDAALAWAKKATVACEGPVEVRPFEDEPGG
jgi:hypothetical protein